MTAIRPSKAAIRGLEQFFLIFWGAVVLNPSGLRAVRADMVCAGLVEPRGKLRLTPSGESIIAHFKAGSP